MARETWVQSQVESYQRLKKWYLMPPCLTLSIIRYGSRVKWSNPGKGVAPSPTPWCSKLLKREPSGHPRLWSPTFLYKWVQTNNYSCQIEIVIWNYGIMHELLVLDRNTWNLIIVNKLLVLNKNTWNHVTVFKL